jgi:predicted metalloprotease with PDZ domain
VLLSVLSILALTTAGLAHASGARAPHIITLAVDATDAPGKLFHAREVIPANSGPLTLYYPKWIPGEHGPTGPIINLAGLRFKAGGESLTWRRDPVDMYAFHLDVPQGATTIEADLEFLAPTFAGGFTSGSSTTSHLAVFAWNWILLSPPVPHTDDLLFDASLRLPAGWRYGTALSVQQESHGEVKFRTVSLTTLIDSPVRRPSTSVAFRSRQANHQ